MINVPTFDDYRHRRPEGPSGGTGRRTIDGLVPDHAKPLVTIVTVVFNNRKHIERAIVSVLAQSYRNIEYIIIDGGSTDGTVEEIKKFDSRIAYWHSSRDGGISDAFNWGASLARGDYVGLVNSDDWMEPEQVAQAIEALNSGSAFVFGDLVYHRRNGEPAYVITGDPDYVQRLWHRMPQVTHPTALVRREVYERHGLFDTSLKIGMDYDWLYRLHLAGVRGVHTRRIRGHMALGGISDASWSRCLDEHLFVALRYGGSRALLVPLFQLRKLKIRIRLMLERWLPKSAAVRVRQFLNPSLKQS